MPLLFVVAGLAMFTVGDKKRAVPAGGEASGGRLGFVLELFGAALMLTGVVLIVYDMAG